MKKYLLICLLLSSCASKVPPLQMISASNIYLLTGVCGDSLTCIYKTRVKVYHKAFSGLLFFKKKENSYRVIFNNPSGFRLFDLTLFSDSMQVNNCLDALNSSQVLQTIEKDMRLLLPELETQPPSFWTSEKKDTVFRYDSGEKGSRLYFFKQNKLQKILSSNSKKRIITSVMFDESLKTYFIKHWNFNMKIKLEKLEK